MCYQSVLSHLIIWIEFRHCVIVYRCVLCLVEEAMLRKLRLRREKGGRGRWRGRRRADENREREVKGSDKGCVEE